MITNPNARALLVPAAAVTLAITGCSPEAGVPVADASHSFPVNTATHGPDAKLGSHNLTLSQQREPITCLGATVTRTGGVISIDARVAPAGVLGVTTSYNIHSSEQPVKGEVAGTHAEVNGGDVGRNSKTWVTIHFPLGKNNVGHDVCPPESGIDIT